MPKHDAIFEEICFYSEHLQKSLVDKLQIFWVDSTNTYQIVPVKEGGVVSYEVFKVTKVREALIFKSKKKAMQYVVSQLFTELFDYEQEFTRDSGLPF